MSWGNAWGTRTWGGGAGAGVTLAVSATATPAHIAGAGGVQAPVRVTAVLPSAIAGTGVVQSSTVFDANANVPAAVLVGTGGIQSPTRFVTPSLVLGVGSVATVAVLHPLTIIGYGSVPSGTTGWAYTPSRPPVISDTFTVYVPRSTPTGWVESTHATYATARTGANLVAYNGSLAYNRVGQLLFSGNYYMFQTMMAFDTSFLGDAEVVEAHLEIYEYNDESTTDFNIEARLYDWGSTMTTADWIPGTQLSSKPLLGTLSTAGYGFTYNRLSDIAMSDNLNTTGITRMVLVSDRLTAGTVPVGAEQVTLYGRPVDTTVVPRLAITVRRPANDNFDDVVAVGPSGIISGAAYGSSMERGEYTPAGPLKFAEDVRYEFPMNLQDGAWVMVGDILYGCGGFARTTPAMPDDTPIPYDGQWGVPNAGTLGSVIAINTMTGEVSKVTDLPALDSSTWVKKAGQYYIGSYCVGAAAMVEIDNVLYVSGGYTNYFGSNPNSPASYGALSTGDANHVNSGAQKSFYSQVTLAIDLDLNTVTRMTDKPCGVEYLSAVAIDGKGYFVGGYTDDNNYPYIDIYDPGTDTWTQSSISPCAMAEAVSVAYNGKVYIVDGDVEPFDTPPDVDMDPTSWEGASTGWDQRVRIYDPATDTWAIGAENVYWEGGRSLGFERDNKLTVLGSYGPSAGGSINPQRPHIYTYDPLLDTWSLEARTVDRMRYYFGGGVRSDGKLYLFGGVQDQPAYHTASIEASVPDGTIWWTWTAPEDGSTSVTLSGIGDVILGVWVGSNISDLSLVGGSGGSLTTTVSFDAEGGVTYYLQAASVSGGNASISLTQLSWPPILGLFDSLPIGG